MTYTDWALPPLVYGLHHALDLARSPRLFLWLIENRVTEIDTAAIVKLRWPLVSKCLA
jgi:hypothetical protein